MTKRKLPDIIYEKVNPEIVARLERTIQPLPDKAEKQFRTVPSGPPVEVRTAEVKWDAPWWVVRWWAHKLPGDEKEGDYPSTEQLRWSAPLPEEHVLAMLQVPSIEWANNNKDQVRAPDHVIKGFGGETPEDVEFLGVYGPGTGEFEVAHRWASKSRAMSASRFIPSVKI